MTMGTINKVQCSARARTNVIWAGKCDSHRHSESFRGGNKESNVRRFIILLSVEGLTSFSINNCTNFFGEKN